MAKEEENGNKPDGTLWTGVFINLVADSVTALTFYIVYSLLGKTYSEQPELILITSAVALAVWSGSYLILVQRASRSKNLKKYLECLAYYFPPTTGIVLAHDEKKRRLKAETELGRLGKIVSGFPDAKIIAEIVDAEKQEESLKKLINQTDRLEDERLARIVNNIRQYAEDILRSVGENGNYNIFRQLIYKISNYEPNGHIKTYTNLLWLFSDMFNMPPKGKFTRKIQKDMIGALKNSIWRVDETHLNWMSTIIEQIMADEEDDHVLARQVLEMLCTLDWEEKRAICQIIFDQSKKRAIPFPRHFGYDVLNTLGQLEHKVFRLDVQSLRDILDESLKDDEGIIELNSEAYEELCSKVFSPLEDAGHEEKHNSRLFRRLRGEWGEVQVECTLPDGTKHTCEGESLGFRGLYSGKCPRQIGEKLKVRAMPIKEVGQPKPKHVFDITASIAKIHDVEAANKSNGRGIFFEDADEETVKRLYEYISSH